MTVPTTEVGAYPGSLARFPFSIPEGPFVYRSNVEPALVAEHTAAGSWGETLFDVNPLWDAEVALRRQVLAADPRRAFASPHMHLAQWDTLVLMMEHLNAVDPCTFRYARDGAQISWTNGRTGDTLECTFGDDSTLPAAGTGRRSALHYIGTQAPEDIVLLDQREGQLWFDAGLVTFASAWSIAFTAGMSFTDIHGPVPRIKEEGVVGRAEQFLMRLTPEKPYRRTNFAFSLGRDLDISMEVSDRWLPAKEAAVDAPDLMERLHGRVEVQHFFRLPHSGAVIMTVRTHLERLADLVTVPEWKARLREYFTTMPADIRLDKGITRYEDRLLEFLDS